ncbi:MAG: hypothetical protein ACRYG4_04260 [Janthinobacterium lividum]
MSEAVMTAAMNKLCKWRTVLAGWHKGSSFTDAPGTPAMRDLMDKWLIMRVEGSALARLMLDKGVFTLAEFQEQLTVEAGELDKSMAQRFPGFMSTDVGITIYDVELARVTTAKLGFPE